MSNLFIDDLMDMFPDTVQVNVRSAPDEYGQTTLISSRDLPARVVGKTKAMLDRQGNEVTSSVQVLFAGVFDLTTDMEYILPVRFQPRNPKPISVEHATDEMGAAFERVFFYWTQVG
jgi:hypothetical protein